MMLYFFNIERRSGLCMDTEGQEFASIAEAHVAAIASLCEIAGDSLRTVDPIEVHAIEVANAAGTVIRTITMTEALRPLLPKSSVPDC